MGKKYEPVKTPLGREELAPILRPVFKDETGEDMGNAEPYLIAMLALENGWGSKIRQHNWGNVIRSGEEQDYYQVGSNPRKFRVLPSHDEGARYFVRTLLSPTNKRIVEAAQADNFDAFFNGIHNISPVTDMAYNHLTGTKRAQALKAYKDIVSKLRGAPVVSNIPISSSSGGGAALIAGIGGAFYASKQPKLRKFFK